MLRFLKQAGQDSCEAGIQFRRGILVFKIDLIRRTHDPSPVFLFLHDFIKDLFDFRAGALGEIGLGLLLVPVTPSLAFCEIWMSVMATNRTSFTIALATVSARPPTRPPAPAPIPRPRAPPTAPPIVPPRTAPPMAPP